MRAAVPRNKSSSQWGSSRFASCTTAERSNSWLVLCASMYSASPGRNCASFAATMRTRSGATKQRAYLTLTRWRNRSGGRNGSVCPRFGLTMTRSNTDGSSPSARVSYTAPGFPDGPTSMAITHDSQYSSHISAMSTKSSSPLQITEKSTSAFTLEPTGASRSRSVAASEVFASEGRFCRKRSGRTSCGRTRGSALTFAQLIGSMRGYRSLRRSHAGWKRMSMVMELEQPSSVSTSHHRSALYPGSIDRTVIGSKRWRRIWYRHGELPMPRAVSTGCTINAPDSSARFSVARTSCTGQYQPRHCGNLVSYSDTRPRRSKTQLLKASIESGSPARRACRASSRPITRTPSGSSGGSAASSPWVTRSSAVSTPSTPSTIDCGLGSATIVCHELTLASRWPAPGKGIDVDRSGSSARTSVRTRGTRRPLASVAMTLRTIAPRHASSCWTLMAAGSNSRSSMQAMPGRRRRSTPGSGSCGRVGGARDTCTLPR
mmetsp:Transcript_18850/g.58492  ORF Transcript_18850/g.58492 Transcript_18850/m.58492 type:complete len:489 (+) Transcript_18850:276-1742(+)